jgi:hypothetical protein
MTFCLGWITLPYGEKDPNGANVEIGDQVSTSGRS